MDVTRVRSRARMEQNFTSTGYTIGIEEELMIVDGETLELANAIEQLLEDGDESARSSPSSWSRCSRSRRRRARHVAEAGDAAARAAARGSADARASDGLAHRLGRHPPVRDVGGPADRRAARATAS